MNSEKTKYLPQDVELELHNNGMDAQSLLVSSFRIDSVAQPRLFRYLSFLKRVVETAHLVAELYDWASPIGSEGSKNHLRLTGPWEMTCIANALYILDSHGVRGDVLECGTSHGYSTCVLSSVCHWLGRKLYAADSFCGLPAVSEEEPFFREGDYAARLEQVYEKVVCLGEPQAVEFIKGFYSESLKGFDQPLAALWIDVDLYDSAADVMRHVSESVHTRGAIFCHEFSDFYGNLQPRSARRPPHAIYDYFDSKRVPYQSKLLMRYFGVIAHPESVLWDSFIFFDKLYTGLLGRDVRYRRYCELRDSSTVKWAYRVKNILFWGRNKIQR